MSTFEQWYKIWKDDEPSEFPLEGSSRVEVRKKSWWRRVYLWLLVSGRAARVWRDG